MDYKDKIQPQSEDKMQHELIMWFSQKYPEHHGDLFMVQNTSYSVKHGVKLRSMGLIKSVSDLLYWGELKAALELKAIDSKHDKEHVINQLNWGKKRIEKGDFFMLTNNLLNAKLFLSLLVQKDIEKARLLEQTELYSLQNRIEAFGRIIKF